MALRLFDDSAIELPNWKQLPLGDQIDRAGDTDLARARFADEILKFESDVANPKKYRLYLLTQPAGALNERLQYLKRERGI